MVIHTNTIDVQCNHVVSFGTVSVNCKYGVPERQRGGGKERIGIQRRGL